MHWINDIFNRQDEESKTYLTNWVDHVNNNFEGLIDVVDRKDPFNVQLAIVTDNYPLDSTLTKLNNISFSFDFNHFYVSGVIIRFS